MEVFKWPKVMHYKVKMRTINLKEDLKLVPRVSLLFK